MKKLGFLFIFALFIQSVMAEETNTQYSNVTVAIAETDTSVNWVTDLNFKPQHALKKDVNELKQNSEKTQLTVNIQLQQRIADMLENSLSQ